MNTSLFSQKGSVLILMAFTIPFLIAISAIATDVGYLYVQRSHLQNIADAAALAGAAKLGTGTAAAEELAEQYININSTAADAGNTSTITFLENNSKIRVDISKQTPLLLLEYLQKYFSFEPVTLAVHAIASYTGAAPNIFNYTFIAGSNTAVLDLAPSGSNIYNGSLHSNYLLTQNWGNNNTVNGSVTAVHPDIWVQRAPYSFTLNGTERGGADPIDITEANPVVSSYIASLKKNAVEMQPGDIGYRTLSSLGERVYIRGDINTYFAWEPSYSGSVIIIADGNISLGFNNINNITADAKIILCSLTGDIEINHYQDIKLSALAPHGNIRIVGGGATIDGFLIGQNITVGGGNRTYKNSKWAGGGDNGGGAIKVRLTE